METLKVEFKGENNEILIVTLNRPEVMNAMNTKMLEERLALFREQAENEDLRCVIVTGAGGKAFSTGGDLKERNNMANRSWRQQHRIIEDLVLLYRDFPVPIIAAVEGYALAGGCEMALSADFIIASETAVFGMSEILRGIIPGAGGPQNLARVIGAPRAKELLYTGRRINADLAYEWGMVNRVVPKGMALETSLEIAYQIAESAPLAVRAAKTSVTRGSEVDFHTAYVLDLAAYNMLVSSEDRLEGVAAFNEKRKPRWKNR
ncbi:enoyl-CoA hydratase/isomerase family protein [Halalkalibacter krulwichiae]|uniref:Putative enoyl-CoA hydratase echA8 n=1 Tax=Halalkalibacter krulwichiae TaxID=199441 RepID=A0A1X9MGJ0_9BACI|nr:enoyl-CoA hydratase-related protein [Halalkalibacter krulwichiae]ARK32589.1 putative enoyl-CoA hydratase echA8 [Halalkalibacter krulwichiae]